MTGQVVEGLGDSQDTPLPSSNAHGEYLHRSFAQKHTRFDSPGFTLLSPARLLIHPFGLINYTAEDCAALVR